MKKRIYYFLIIIAFLIGIAYFFLPKELSISHKKTEIKIATTIFPLADIAKNIVQDKGDVVLILSSGASPHTFELTPEKIKDLQDVKVVFKVGLLDNWIDGISDSLPDIKKVEVKQGIDLKKNTEKDLAGDYDPHYWLDLKNGAIIAKNICDELIVLDPKNKDFYQNNLAEYKKQVESLDISIKNKLLLLKNKKIIVFHNAWNYFSDAYGLEIVGVFEISPGKEITPQELVKIGDTIKKYNIRSIFSEPQFSSQAMQQIIEDYHVGMYVLDPLGGVKNRESYMEMMMYNADIIINGLL